MEEKEHVNKISRSADFIFKQRFVSFSTENEHLVRAGGDDPTVAARQDHHFGHFCFGIQADEVGRETGLCDRDVGTGVAAASRYHSVVDCGELVEA